MTASKTNEDPVPLKMLITFLSGIYRDVTSWEKLLPPTFFCCDLLRENSYPVALPRSQKTCGNGGSELTRREDVEGGCSTRVQCKRRRSGRESLRRGFGKYPPTHPDLRATTSGHRSKCMLARSPSTRTSSASRRGAFVLYHGTRWRGRSARACRSRPTRGG